MNNNNDFSQYWRAIQGYCQAESLAKRAKQPSECPKCRARQGF